MVDIQFYNCRNIGTIKKLKSNFAQILTEKDRIIVNDIWKGVKLERGDKAFSSPCGLGSLYDTSGGFTFQTTDFMTYLGVSISYHEQSLSSQAYTMKVSSVGAVVRLRNGYIFIHKRGKDVSHQKDVLDSSVGGLAHIEGETINFQKSLSEKLARELKLSPDEIKHIEFRGAHSSLRYDFSGMFDFLVDTNLDVDDLESRIDKTYFGEYHLIPRNQLLDFIVKHYAELRDMSGDGFATLASSLDTEEFKIAVEKVRKLGRVVKFGELKNGVFVESG